MLEKLFDGMLRATLRMGSFEVTMPGGATRSYGDGSGETLRVRIHDTATLGKFLLNPELVLGEAYMNGTLTIGDDDLRGFLAAVVSNVRQEHVTRWQKALSAWRQFKRKARQYNPVGTARRNVAHHYDLSGELYDLFLDADKQYSCAYFPSPDTGLDEAQERKKAHIASKLLIEPGMRVLDIGCGWGGMGLTLARDFGARVIGVTLSEEQHRVARSRAEAEGLSDRVEFRLMDYRHVTETFDRIVSVGMFEHVGAPHYDEYFRHVRDRMTEDGVALIHSIGRATPPGTTNPWILKYIFPGGYIPAMSEAMKAVENQNLWPTDIEIWRLHYAETLRHWQERFMANIEKIKSLHDERFCRMWRFYLAASEMTFRHNRQFVFQLQLARKQDTVPLTRDYLYRTGGTEAIRTETERQ